MQARDVAQGVPEGFRRQHPAHDAAGVRACACVCVCMHVRVWSCLGGSGVVRVHCCVCVRAHACVCTCSCTRTRAQSAQVVPEKDRKLFSDVQVGGWGVGLGVEG